MKSKSVWLSTILLEGCAESTPQNVAMTDLLYPDCREALGPWIGVAIRVPSRQTEQEGRAAADFSARPLGSTSLTNKPSSVRVQLPESLTQEFMLNHHSIRFP